MYKRVDATWAWVKYTIIGCWCFGCGNAFMGLLASKFGLYGISLLSFGQLFNWAIYHALFAKNSSNRTVLTMFAVMLRALTHLGVMIVTFSAFYFADKAKINQGVIAAIFTSSVAFSTIVFYCLYDEKIKYPTLCGMGIIMVGVVCVGLR